MWDWFKKVDYKVKRNLSFVILALIAANSVWFLKPILSKLMDYTILGNLDIASVLGIISLFAIVLFYLKKM